MKLLIIHPFDNVAVSPSNICKGQWVFAGNSNYTLTEDIPAGHKISTTGIKKGSSVIKYGYPIGCATKNIAPGFHVHSHNMETSLAQKEQYKYEPVNNKIPESGNNLCFEGYIRKNGMTAVRNEIWIIPTVNCVNQTAKHIEQLGNKKFSSTAGIDGIHSFSHPYGCSQLGDDLETTQKILAGLANHPNAAGVLIIGLGCENNNIPEFKKLLKGYNGERMKFLTAQQVENEVEKGVELVGQLVEYSSRFKRQKINISELIVGLKCGGSDGFSGITANPLVGRFSNKLLKYGGSAVMTETPEMFGAEQILMNRARDENTFKKIQNLVCNFKEYFTIHGQPIHENPSPGNREGGITTLEEKSLGCILKGGSYEVSDVIPYGSVIRKKGLTLLEGPGNDLVSITALAALGCHLILFTTGRGTPLGTCVPTLKISTNTQLYRRKPSWIDFDSGEIIAGMSIDNLSEQLLSVVVSSASGHYLTENEKNDFRQIGIWKKGITL